MMKEYLHLEVDSAETRNWVQKQNAITRDLLCDDQFSQDCAELEQIFDADDKLVVARTRGDWHYHFLINATHKKGLWRRRKDENSDWQAVFDLDLFCAQNEGDWEWRGADTCRWERALVMISLSLGGSDKCQMFEFNCDTGKRVDDGFEIPASKTRVAWAGRDRLLVSGGAHSGDGTNSGWPRKLRLWQRGEELNTARVIYQVASDDLSVHAWCAGMDDDPFLFLSHRTSFSSASYHAGTVENGVRSLELPVNIDILANEKYLAFMPYENDCAWPQGSLVLARHDGKFDVEFDFEAIFSPGERCFLDRFFILRDTLYFSLNNNLQPEIYSLDLSMGASEPVRVQFPDGFSQISIIPENAPDLPDGKNMLALCEGPLTPPCLFRFSSGQKPELVDQTLACFSTENLVVELLEAQSSDGEMIPYHVVRPRDVNIPVPTLIYGYGGFNISVGANYAPSVGKLWLERGNAYVYAHLRGGDEFGPAWHEAAKGPKKRQTTYEDMVAIARDLQKRGISVASKTAVLGGSNGGLMAGVMMTQFPDDFGAVWSSVPVLDMKRYVKFEAGLAWVDEYGDPQNPEDWAYMKKYSPYHLVEKGKKYPPILFSTSATDDRVHPSHARRMAAKMLDQGHEPSFYESTSGGHAGAGASAPKAERFAMGFSFLRKMLGS